MADGGVEGGGLLELYWSSGGPKGSGDFGSCGQWELWQWPQSSSDPRGVACGILAKAEALGTGWLCSSMGCMAGSQGHGSVAAGGHRVPDSLYSCSGQRVK